MARAHAAEFRKNDTLESFMEHIKERDAERIVMDELDALFLRNDSIEDLQQRPWASPMGPVFGHMLQARGVTVVNDPTSLIRATSKLYLEEFPDKIRPRSLVKRDPDAIERFVGDVGHCVVKPLYGAKGGGRATRHRRGDEQETRGRWSARPSSKLCNAAPGEPLRTLSRLVAASQVDQGGITNADQGGDAAGVVGAVSAGGVVGTGTVSSGVLGPVELGSGVAEAC